MTMFENVSTVIHPKLVELHKKAKCHKPCCVEGKCEGKQCIAYCGCGCFDTQFRTMNVVNECKNPCKHCLVWSGYGFQDDIEVLVKMIEESQK